MKDIEAYVFITFHAPRFNMDEETILYYLNKQGVMPVVVTPRELRLMQDFAPPAKYVVHELKRQGFSNKFIAEYMNVAPPNISYHLKTKPKMDWVHPTWEGMRVYQKRQDLSL